MIIVSHKGNNYHRYIKAASIRKIDESFYTLEIPNYKSNVYILKYNVITIDDKEYDIKFINENFERMKAIIENESNKYLLDQL
jgi:hypothetical protein